MCELLGLCLAQPASASISIRDFAHRGEENADGWGLAWYPDRSLAIVKEPVKWRASPYTDFLERYSRLASSLYIAHVRHRTTGGAPTRADTHPFARELAGREYCFAHNGTIQGPFWELPLGRFRPIGKTDSEHVFCHLLEGIARLDHHLADETGWRWLYGQLAALNRSGRINCLLSDGERLFCYHDAGGWKGLHLSKIYIRENKLCHFGDETLRIDLGQETAVNQGFVIASQPLSGKGWLPFQPGELLVVEAGLARYSSHRAT
jgi:glutamine amidotransferase